MHIMYLCSKLIILDACFLCVCYCTMQIEVLSPVTGELCFSISDDGGDASPVDDPIAGLHLFKKQTVESPSRYFM